MLSTAGHCVASQTQTQTCRLDAEHHVALQGSTQHRRASHGIAELRIEYHRVGHRIMGHIQTHQHAEIHHAPLRSTRTDVKPPCTRHTLPQRLLIPSLREIYNIVHHPSLTRVRMPPSRTSIHLTCEHVRKYPWRFAFKGMLGGSYYLQR